MGRAAYLVAVSLIAVSQTGCGTLHNLNAPPVERPERASFIGCGPVCIPFGGVARSGLLGIVGPIGAIEAVEGGSSIVRGKDVSKGFSKMGNGMAMMGLGLVALVDIPLSLAGDIVTLPIAYARQNEHPWATWWGREPGTCWLHTNFSANPKNDEPSPVPEKAP